MTDDTWMPRLIVKVPGGVRLPWRFPGSAHTTWNRSIGGAETAAATRWVFSEVPASRTKAVGNTTSKAAFWIEFETSSRGTGKFEIVDVKHVLGHPRERVTASRMLSGNPIPNEEEIAKVGKSE